MGHIDSYKKFANREKKIQEQEGEIGIAAVPEQFKADNDAINNLKDIIARTEQDLAAKKVELNNKVKDLQSKLAAEQAKIKNQQSAQSGTAQPVSQ